MQSLGEEPPLTILAGISKHQSPEEKGEKKKDEAKSEGESLKFIPIEKSDINYIAGKSPSIGGNLLNCWAQQSSEGGTRSGRGGD